MIRSGLSPADRVIIDGVQHAQPGKPVTVRVGQIATSSRGGAGAGRAAGLVGDLRPQ